MTNASDLLGSFTVAAQPGATKEPHVITQSGVKDLYAFIAKHRLTLASETVKWGHYAGKRMELFATFANPGPWSTSFFVEIDGKTPHGVDPTGYFSLEKATEAYNDYASPG